MFIQCRTFIFWNAITKTSRSGKFLQKGYQDAVLVSFTATPPNITIDNHTGGGGVSSLLSIKRKYISKKIYSSFGVTYREVRDFGMKFRALEAKDDCSFWSSGKRRKGFSKINNSVNSSLQRWIIYHPRIIQYPIENDYITVKFDDVIR